MRSANMGRNLTLIALCMPKSMRFQWAVPWVRYSLTFSLVIMKDFCSKNIVSLTCILMILFFFLFSIPSKMLRPFIPNLIHFIQPFSSPWKENSCTLSFFGRTGRTERRFFHYQYLSEAYVHMFIHHIENFYS